MLFQQVVFICIAIFMAAVGGAYTMLGFSENNKVKKRLMLCIAPLSIIVSFFLILMALQLNPQI